MARNRLPAKTKSLPRGERRNDRFDGVTKVSERDSLRQRERERERESVVCPLRAGT